MYICFLKQCREECLLNVSLAEMKCVDPFFVAYPNTAKICKSRKYRTFNAFRFVTDLPYLRFAV